MRSPAWADPVLVFVAVGVERIQLAVLADLHVPGSHAWRAREARATFGGLVHFLGKHLERLPLVNRALGAIAPTWGTGHPEGSHIQISATIHEDRSLPLGIRSVVQLLANVAADRVTEGVCHWKTRIIDYRPIVKVSFPGKARRSGYRIEGVFHCQWRDQGP